MDKSTLEYTAVSGTVYSIRKKTDDIRLSYAKSSDIESSNPKSYDLARLKKFYEWFSDLDVDPALITPDKAFAIMDFKDQLLGRCIYRKI